MKRILKRPKNLEGVLRWCVVGAQEWYSLEKGLVIPILLQLKLKKQQNDLDYLGQWIEDCCEEDTGAFTKHEDLYPSYLNWCKTNGVEPRAKIAFSQGLTSKGFINCRQSVGGKRSRGFSGLKLTAEELQSPANHRASMGMAIDELTTELVDAEDITIPPIQQQNGHEHIKMKAGRRTN